MKGRIVEDSWLRARKQANSPEEDCDKADEHDETNEADNRGRKPLPAGSLVLA